MELPAVPLVRLAKAVATSAAAMAEVAVKVKPPIVTLSPDANG